MFAECESVDVRCRGGAGKHSQCGPLPGLHEALRGVPEDQAPHPARRVRDPALLPARLRPESLHRAQASQVVHLSGMGIVLGSADFRGFLIDFQKGKKKNLKKKNRNKKSL